MARRIAFACLTAAILVAAVSLQSAYGQVLYGSIVGTIEDPTSAVVPKATVTITNAATGATRETTSDDAGRYSIVNVVPGTYELKVTAQGFRTLTNTDVEVTINSVTRIDAKLEVGQVAEQVTVSASAAALRTEKSDVATEIGAKAVQDLPLPGYRNYQSLINLVPGATPAGFQNAVVDTPARALTTNVNGTNRNNNNTRVDGATNVFIWLPHHTVYVQPVESIETVNITTGSMDAEQGMAGGAAITVSTKSGTNDIHGVAFWYHQNQHLKSRNFFDRVKDLPFANLNIFGGALGGPILKNKWFYFGSYERTTERSGQVGDYSVPTAAMKAGDFSSYTADAIIYDPLTGAPDGRNRTPFLNNQIPSARISSIFNKIQALAPLPNQPGSGVGNLDRNFTTSGTFKLDRNNYDFKTNYNLSEKLMIWGKYSRMDSPVTGLVPFGVLVGDPIGSASPGNGDTTVQIPTAGFNLTISPTMFVDGVFGYTRFDQTVQGLDFGTNYGSDVFGIPGTNGGQQFANDKRYSGMPVFDQGLSTWGQTATWIPLFRNDRSYTFTTNASKLHRGHEFRFGYDMVRHELNHWQPETANPRGALTFGGNRTTLNGGPASVNLNQYASALLGEVTSFDKSVQYFTMTTREWQFGLYVRDRWQVTRKLTLNLGLRWEYYPLISREGRGIERWDPATNLVYLGGLGNTPGDAGISTNRSNFAPRVGFAYKVNDKTVIRSGYGITPNPLPFSRPLRGLYPATIASNDAALTTYGGLTTLAAGIPEVPTPDVSSGVISLPKNVDMGPRSPWSNLTRGYIQSWNFTVEHRFPADFIGSVAYVGTQTVHQLGDRDINAAAPGTEAAGRPFLARNGNIGLNMWDGFASGDYHALQITADRAFKSGFYLKNSFTWSKAINMFDDDGWVGLPITNWEPAIRRNRAVAGYDRTFMFVTAGTWDMPFGKGRKYNMKGVTNAVLGGWSLNGFFSAYSGLPFTVTGSDDSLRAPGSSQTADLIGKAVNLGNVGPGTQYYDVSAFTDPRYRLLADANNPQFGFGAMGRNALRGPGFFKLDTSLFKNFSITERVTLQFKAEGYNITNRTRFNNPNADVSSALFDASGHIIDPRDFMAITRASRDQDRQFRFGLRLSF